MVTPFVVEAGGNLVRCSGYFRVAGTAAFLNLMHGQNIAGPSHVRGRARGGITRPDRAVPGLAVGGSRSSGAAGGVAFNIHRLPSKQFS